MDISYFFPNFKLYAGDSWKWSIDLAYYPASTGWRLAYVAKKQGQISKTFLSEASGDSHLISVSKDNTSLYVPGDWTISVSLLSNDGEKITLGTKNIEILPDLSEVGEAFDPRTHNQKCLDALKAVTEQGVGREILEETFQDHTIKYKSSFELEKLKTKYQMAVDEENGIKPGRIIYNRI